MTEHYSDKELLELLKNDDNRNYAFNLFVRKYQQKIYLHIRRIVINHDDANDVVQNTFIKIWKGIGKFREESKIFTWIYRIATNEAISFLNKKRCKYFIPFINVEKKLSESLESDQYFKADKIEKKFQKAILKLPERQRIIFNMKYFDELKYEEMSEILNVTTGALKASYHHAVTKIEKYLKED
ncbi:MAG: RNA polymerase sigma factor [Bacteroidales bacterium]|nr:RNA polymerase sigma factor [Bacteroidales bacterium]